MMESGLNDGSSSGSSSRHSEQLKLNKQSHKICKPVRKSSIEQQQQQPQNSYNNNPPKQQPQPPVYNINKNDFRNVVQKLTGSPAQDRISVPPPIHPPKPPSLRLQKIRPPPLAPINRPPPPLIPPSPINRLPVVAPPTVNNNNNNNGNINNLNGPFSPLPPLPQGNTAESPISAYMRNLQYSITNDSELKRVPVIPPPQLSLLSPRSNPPRYVMHSQISQFLLPSPFARPPHAMLSPPSFQYPHPMSSVFPFSPTPQLGFSLPSSPGFMFPLSPAGRLPIASPKWKDLSDF